MAAKRTAAQWMCGLAVVCLLAACGGGASNAPAGLAGAQKALTPANITLQDGVWWNPSESGRGYTIELKGNQLVLTLYMYETSGVAVWYSGLLTQQPNGEFTGALARFSGGQTLTGAYQAPTGMTTAANVTLTAHSATSATLALQPTGGAAHSVAIQKFAFGAGNNAGFQNGVWWNAAQSGRGFYIEAQGSQVSIGGYMYDASGQPVWYTALATLGSNGMSATGPLLQISGGQTLGGAYKAPTGSTTIGNITFTASSGNSGELALPDGSKVALSRFVFAGTAPTGTDLASYASANITPLLTMAGGSAWMPTDNPSNAVIPFWNNVRSGHAQLEGVSLAGWAYTGFSNTATSVTTVRAVFLQQQANGLMAEATGAVLGNPNTNGTGAILVADFNGDGRDDVVYSAHNESPFLWQASTAFMSRGDGGFDRITVPDAVMNHDARVVTLGGVKRILSRSFGGSGQNGNGPGFNVIYTWNGTNFSVDTSLGDLGGMSVTAGQFAGDGQDWIAIGDSTFGADGQSFSPTNPMLNYLFRYSGSISKPGVSLPKPYFNDKAEYSGFASQWDPVSKTHTSRMYTTDLNQDGRPDIIAGQEIWSGSAGLQRSALQLLVNQGNNVFHDQTDVLAPEYDKTSRHIDYSLRLGDLDGSGIDSIQMVSTFAFTPSLTTPAGNFLLVNDGTGRLYAALGNAEFSGMAGKIISYATSRVGAGRIVNPNSVPAFLPYRTSQGLIHYVAMVQSLQGSAPFTFTGYHFINVPLGINLATDFRRSLTIPTRNGSRNIRTFAGNDVIHRAVSDPDCRIDGGLGVNTAVYPGPRSNWVIARSGSDFTVRPAAGGGTDTLTRIQRAQFDDQTVELALLP